MDDIGAAIQNFLAQPGAMEQVEAMARQLGLEPGEPAGPSTESGSGLSPELVSALSGALQGASAPNEATALLEALRPMLRPEKQNKVDRAIRAVRMMHTARLLSKTIEL